jgi:hypothetical protein
VSYFKINKLNAQPFTMFHKSIACLLFCCSIFLTSARSQDPWKLSAANINPADYYGVTVANGMIGIV